MYILCVFLSLLYCYRLTLFWYIRAYMFFYYPSPSDLSAFSHSQDSYAKYSINLSFIHLTSRANKPMQQSILVKKVETKKPAVLVKESTTKWAYTTSNSISSTPYFFFFFSLLYFDVTHSYSVTQSNSVYLYTYVRTLGFDYLEEDCEWVRTFVCR